MSLWTSRGVGQYVAGEGHVTLASRRYRADGTVVGGIIAHGFTVNELGVVDRTANPNAAALMATLAETMPILSPYLGGDTWANDTGLARMASAKSYLQGTVGAKPGPVVLFGASMGGALVMAYTRANMANVACSVLLLPVSNLADMHANNRGGSRASINAAYGGLYSDATHGPTHNPEVFKGQLAGVPTQIWYCTDDTVVLPATVESVATANPAAELHPMTGGHGDAGLAQMDADTILAFIHDALI